MNAVTSSGISRSPVGPETPSRGAYSPVDEKAAGVYASKPPLPRAPSPRPPPTSATSFPSITAATAAGTAPAVAGCGGGSIAAYSSTGLHIHRRSFTLERTTAPYERTPKPAIVTASAASVEMSPDDVIFIDDELNISLMPFTLEEKPARSVKETMAISFGNLVGYVESRLNAWTLKRIPKEILTTDGMHYADHVEILKYMVVEGENIILKDRHVFEHIGIDMDSPPPVTKKLIAQVKACLKVIEEICSKPGSKILLPLPPITVPEMSDGDDLVVVSRKMDGSYGYTNFDPDPKAVTVYDADQISVSFTNFIKYIETEIAKRNLSLMICNNGAVHDVTVEYILNRIGKTTTHPITVTKAVLDSIHATLDHIESQTYSSLLKASTVRVDSLLPLEERIRILTQQKIFSRYNILTMELRSRLRYEKEVNTILSKHLSAQSK